MIGWTCSGQMMNEPSRNSKEKRARITDTKLTKLFKYPMQIVTILEYCCLKKAHEMYANTNCFTAVI